jgi:hippurate hydrolase
MTFFVRISRAIAIASAAGWGSFGDASEPIRRGYLADHSSAWVTLYQELHAAPELSFQETKTAEKLAATLSSFGYDVSTAVGKTGYVAVLTNGPGPTLMMRTDLDGLPVVEQTGLPYASHVRARDPRGVEVGVMHACAHDMHMACQIAAAQYLADHRESWSGTLVLIGQPAEEIGGGAKAMLADGLFVRFPRPDAAVALHVDPEMKAGTIGYRAGNLYASVDSVDIVVHGKGGHGAFPHTAIDPVVQAAHLIIDLQTLVSRETNPLEPAVITVGSIHAGTKHNIIDSACKLQLTVRAYSPEVRERLKQGIVRKTKAAASSAGAPEPDIEFSDDTPATINDSALVEKLVPAFQRTLGSKNVIEVLPVMGGEDFSQFGLAGVPIAMFRLGTQDTRRIESFAEREQPLPSLHSPFFYPEPATTLDTGVITLITAALEFMPLR